MKYILTALLIYTSMYAHAQQPWLLSDHSSTQSFFLRSAKGYNGNYNWTIRRSGDVPEDGTVISTEKYDGTAWYPAIVPGTVLNTLVTNKIYPDPYFGDNNRKSRQLIPDLAEAGAGFYQYWFRTVFSIPSTFAGKRIWIKLHGINYRCEIWLNGKKLGEMAGMFNSQAFDITSMATLSQKNVLAVNVRPVDVPGTNSKPRQDRPGAIGENRNGGDGEIGKNVSMLMSVGWDFTAPDGIRDRNTGIWRDVEVFATGDVILEHPFVKTGLPLPDTNMAATTVSVEVANASGKTVSGTLSGHIKESNTRFTKNITLAPGERRTIIFSPSEFKQLQLDNPRLWWPVNKGPQHLYNLEISFASMGKKKSHTITDRFGIREIHTDRNSPDSSRRFYVNGHPIFIRGTNWIPEAMLRNSEKRVYAELRYTRQAGLNLVRLWGGGIAESDYFYRLCDEYGILVWTEFWMTGDTRFPADTALYFKNVASTIKRLRNHASSAYYVSSNESTEVKGAASFIHNLDDSRDYQMQSECCGIHDGSPYKYENPMQYFENTASQRGSRIDGFNPEYGTPCLPTVESLRKMMPEKDLWPINDSVWKYMDGGGFHQMITKYRQAVNEFGPSSSIEEFAKKAQFIGALNFRAIWEVWNYNKFHFGDRFASGFLFWYHNSPLPQVAGRMYDWSLEPTAALYYSQNGLAPLHPQFDYLKNTVSVYNDYRKIFKNYTVTAALYDIHSKKINEWQQPIDIPADGLAKDVLKLEFPTGISAVHFIKLELKDEKGKLVSDAFYWRSSDIYKGAWTLTGPAVSGFSSLNDLSRATITTTPLVKKKKGSKTFIDITIQNAGASIAFFTQVKLVDTQGRSITPAYYSDNFINLLPGEKKKIKIEFASRPGVQLMIDGWNVKTRQLTTL